MYGLGRAPSLSHQTPCEASFVRVSIPLTREETSWPTASERPHLLILTRAIKVQHLNGGQTTPNLRDTYYLIYSYQESYMRYSKDGRTTEQKDKIKLTKVQSQQAAGPNFVLFLPYHTTSQDEFVQLTNSVG